MAINTSNRQLMLLLAMNPQRHLHVSSAQFRESKNSFYFIWINCRLDTTCDRLTARVAVILPHPQISASLL